jgi:hypothetical protein
VAAPQEKRSRSETARTGWSLTHLLSKRILEVGLVSDHPVCGASVASRLFINAAATPPHEEGNVVALTIDHRNCETAVLSKSVGTGRLTAGLDAKD